ncbi:hypothetical protein A4F85_09600 [Delftia sp. GW456-R20]|nr:hypothetical protein A4F85_09600 [Delftia sp. GW456-R20]
MRRAACGRFDAAATTKRGRYFRFDCELPQSRQGKCRPVQVRYPAPLQRAAGNSPILMEVLSLLFASSVPV